MIYLAATNLVLAAFAVYLLRTLTEERKAQRTREDTLMNRIQAPQIAVTQSLPQDNEPQPYISYGDDEALARYEEQKRAIAEAAR
jgi:CHASE3 domain sensor protein